MVLKRKQGAKDWAFLSVPDYAVADWLKSVEAKRQITKIVIHHTGFDAPYEGIDSWYKVHAAHKRRGWLGIGYHIGISPEGRVATLRPLSLIGAHCEGHNAKSIGVVVWGRHNKTKLQLTRLAQVVAGLQKRFGAKVYFHSDLNRTACPEIDKAQFRKLLQSFGGDIE